MSTPSKQNRQSTASASASASASAVSGSGSSGNKSEDNFLVHPTSKWQEPMREDELTLWEVHRKPRKLIHNQVNERMIRCPLKMLNPEFRCVICLGYLKNTTMVMVCLHRFCGECIHKCIRFGMKECPSCRKPIPSRRSLRRDTNFDKIVQNMVGTASQQQLEDEQYGKSRTDNNKIIHLQRAIQKKKNITERQRQRTAELKHQQQNQNGDESSSPLTLSGTSASAPASQVPTKHNPGSNHSNRHQLRLTNLEPSPLLELELRRHPNELKVDRLDKGYLTVRADAKVSLLKTFLSQKLRMDTVYEITSNLDDDSVVLDDDMALMHAQETLCPNNERVMVLKYKTKTSGRWFEIPNARTRADENGGDDGDMVDDTEKLEATSQNHSTTDGASTHGTGIGGNYRDI